MPALSHLIYQNAISVNTPYLLGVDGQGGAGVYFWSSIEAAQRAHDADWVAETEARTGQPVRIRYFDLLMTLDNEDGSLKDGHGVPLAV